MTSQLYPPSPTQHTDSPTSGDVPLSSPSSFSGSGSERSSLMTARRTRSSRACDQCRRNKNKCEPASGAIAVCRSCLSMGIACTFTNPSRKRGPPKGYILALERRLQQVEALLGTVINSQDSRARSLVVDLAQDPLAYHIMRRVERGPFSPTHQPLGTTKQDFLESMIMSDQDPYDGAASDDSFAVPDYDWHQRIQDILEAGQASRMRRESLQSTTSASSSHHPTATRSNPSPTSRSNAGHSFSGPMTPVDTLSPLTPASLTMAPSSTSSPIQTPGNSPYPAYPYMTLPASSQSQHSAAPGQYSVQAQYAAPHASSSNIVRGPYGSGHATQGQSQQPQSSAAGWFQDFDHMSSFGDASELQDTKPGIGLGSSATSGGGAPMLRVYDSAGYDVSNARMQGNGRYPCPA